VFESIDVHNNTGLNPHYACVNRLHASYLHLATLFSRVVVYFTKPNGVQSKAMSELCPAVTLECGNIEQQYGAEHACDYLDACLHLSQHPQHPAADHDIGLFHTTGIVKISKAINFGYHGENLDLSLETDLEPYNFRELDSGTLFGKTKMRGAFSGDRRKWR
jgi:succinylglutamate desuccinylase